MLTYNREKFVTNMIEDVLKQSYKDFEFLIIDNGSTDGTPLLLKEYSNNYTRIRIITLLGGSIGHARNVGVNSAKGDYIAFVDDDDRIEPDYLEFLYNLIQSDGADIAICGTSEGDGCTRKPQCILNEKRVLSGEEAVSLLLERKYIRASTPGKLYDKKLLKLWPFLEDYKHEDIHTQYKYMLSAKKVVIYGLDKYYFTRHEGNISRFTSAAEMWTRETMCEYLMAYHNRTEFVRENALGIYQETLYSEWSYMISMIDKISLYKIEECNSIQKELIRIIASNKDEFCTMPWIKDFELKWIKSYIDVPEK